MIAHILVLTLLIELALYVLLGGYFCWVHDTPIRLVFIGCIIFFLGSRGLWFALQFLLAWLYRTPRDQEKQIGLMGAVRLFVTEIWAYWKVFMFWQIFASWLVREPSAMAKNPPGLPPLLLVHGIWCNRGVWYGFKKKLAALGVEQVYAIDLIPLSGTIETYAEQLAQRIDMICRNAGSKQVILIAHSLGGLVARSYLQHYGQEKVAQLITLGTPHHGSELAWFALGPAVKQLRPGSSALIKLNSADTGAIPITSLYSLHDNLVAPQASSHLPHAKNIPLSGLGHLELLISQEVFELAMNKINSLHRNTA